MGGKPRPEFVPVHVSSPPNHRLAMALNNCPVRERTADGVAPADKPFIGED